MRTAGATGSLEAVEVTGCSYRQLDYWATRGYVKPIEPSPGSGQQRDWPDRELRVARLIRALEGAGFRLEVAAAIARARVEENEVSHQLAEGVVLEVLPDGAAA